MDALLDAVVPCGCAVCGTAVPIDRPPLCALCRSRLVEIPRPTCRRCGLTRIVESSRPGECAACSDWPPGLRAASACLLEGIASRLVHGLKYRAWTALAEPMGHRMVPAARRLAGAETPVLIPVPLSAARRRERGFNQAELLAQELAIRTGWPLETPLVRRSGGRAFAGLGRLERAARAADAFVATPESLRGEAQGQRALLVDDVITTGATAGACAAALETAGIRCIGAVSFARTGRSLVRS